MRRGGNIDRSLSALALAVLALASGFARAAGGDTPGVRVEASFTADDNVTRAAGDDALSDSILGVRVGASAAVPISTHTRALVQGFAGAERFNTYTGLSRNFIGAQGDFKYRASGEFGAATYGGFVRTAAEFYESNLRDGYRHSFGVSVLKPWTDRIQLSSALAWNITDGSSTVFDAKNLSLRGNADWSLTRWDVVYFGLEYRRGDSVSTARPSLTIVNSVDAIVRDDAFDDTARFAYRFKASAWLASLGYNRAFAERHSVDISWRGVKTTPSDSALSELGYVVNQFSLAYLARF
jgi:hypothetical protein